MDLPSGSPDAGPEVPSGPLQLAVFVDEVVVVYPLPETGGVTIGRSSENQVRIDHPSVSRRHALFHIGPPLQVEDLGSANGTFVQDPRRPRSVLSSETHHLCRIAEQPAGVKVGDRVTIPFRTFTWAEKVLAPADGLFVVPLRLMPEQPQC